jgi:hypothetical protein
LGEKNFPWILTPNPDPTEIAEIESHRPWYWPLFLCIPLGTVITPDLFTYLIGHTSGGLKGIPSNAEAIALLT